MLALFAYRRTIEALGKVRFMVPISIIFALGAGTRPEFTTYLSTSRIVVFFPFFVAGYLWKSDYTKIVRKFKGKWVLVPISGLLLYGIPNFMIANEMPVDILRGNHSYQVSGMDDVTGMLIRLLMYLVSFVLVLTFLALMPDRKLPITFVGRNTMGIYLSLIHIYFLYFSAGLGNIDETIYERASVDGASSVQQFFSLTLPGLSPIMFYTLVVNIIQAFQSFGQIKILTEGGPNESTNVIVYSIYRDAFFNYRFGSAAAQSVILFIIIMIITLIMFRIEKKGVRCV